LDFDCRNSTTYISLGAELRKSGYTPRKRRGPAVLTPAVLGQAQQLLDEGLETPQVADRLGIKRDTLRKAVRAGRLHKPVKKTLSRR
jgi:hypothetical protein